MSAFFSWRVDWLEALGTPHTLSWLLREGGCRGGRVHPLFMALHLVLGDSRRAEPPHTQKGVDDAVGEAGLELWREGGSPRVCAQYELAWRPDSRTPPPYSYPPCQGW
jgi:hypothetical protein